MVQARKLEEEPVTDKNLNEAFAEQVHGHLDEVDDGGHIWAGWSMYSSGKKEELPIISGMRGVCYRNNDETWFDQISFARAELKDRAVLLILPPMPTPFFPTLI